MKKLLSLALTLLVSFSLYSQDWNTSGNTVVGGSWLGTINNQPIPFRTNNTFRFGITAAGRFGLNTTAPDMLFHVDGGGLLVTGTTATAPNLGAGTRLMWRPGTNVFRVGTVGIGAGTATWWDSGNTGNNSYAMGEDLLVEGEYSYSFGRNSQSLNDRSYNFGNNNTQTGVESYTFGFDNSSAGGINFTMGKFNDVSGIFNYAYGCELDVDADFSMTLGFGVINGAELVNTTDNSMVIGFNSDQPTLFVGPSAGAGTFGNVGIGNIFNPSEVLDINGTLRLRQTPNNSGDVLITGVQQSAAGDYALNYLTFSGNQSDYWQGMEPGKMWGQLFVNGM